MGDRIGNPLFKNLRKGDFRLTTGSPAIGAGTNLQYDIDFDGQAIRKGRPAIGAFEYRK
jgi:hypothetical protein